KRAFEPWRWLEEGQQLVRRLEDNSPFRGCSAHVVGVKQSRCGQLRVDDGCNAAVERARDHLAVAQTDKAEPMRAEQDSKLRTHADEAERRRRSERYRLHLV